VAGRYFVVLQGYFSGDEGSYALHFATVPGSSAVPAGDQGGALANGGRHDGELTRGDMDPWTFEAATGDRIFLRMATDSAYPKFTVLAPDGSGLGVASDGSSSRDVELQFVAASAGIHTVVAEGQYAGDSGPYALHFVKIPGILDVPPGDQGGALVNGFSHAGDLTRGDLDPWTFTAQAGDRVRLRMTSTGAYPRFSVMNPAGTEIAVGADGSSSRNAAVDFISGSTGTFTVVARGYYGGDEGAYTLRLSRVAPDLTVPQNLTVNEGEVLTATLSAQDPDVPPKALVFELLSGPPGAQLTAGAPTNATVTWSPTESDGPGTVTFVARVTDLVDGVFHRRTNAFDVRVREVNRPPEFAPLEVVSGDELVPLVVTPRATDPDLPPNPLVFSLISGPQGSSVDPVSGALSWIPSEADGPSTHEFVLVVADSSPEAVNATSLQTTNRVRVVIRERNTAPVLPAVADREVEEGEPLSIPLAASDADLPPNLLTFELIEAPSGTTLNPAGILTWTPGEEQGPAAATVRFRVRDDGIPAMAATNAFSIVVREVNRAPVFEPVSDQQIPDDTEFRIAVRASDPDLPVNTLSYRLAEGAPDGARLDPASGELVWQVGIRTSPETRRLVVLATDDGVPPRQTELAFNVHVLPPTLRLQRIADQQADEESLWTLTAVVTNSPGALPPFQFTLEGEAPEGLTLNAASGLMFWRPSEAQGPASHRLALAVTDAAQPPNRHVQSFELSVREVNREPVIQPVPRQEVAVGAVLNLSLTASDDDLPPNLLTYVLDPEAPVGMTLAPNGVLRWVPGPSAVGTTNMVTVRVSDDGDPVLSGVRTITVVVPAASAPGLSAEPQPDGLLHLTLRAGVGQVILVEASENLRTWSSLTNLVTGGPVTVLLDPAPPAAGPRYYRATAP
ncbi:MAG: hypothetical protein J0L84_12770, partial [Verrucomicrobia bacterium]|nr:hypothetical protein [Verrucomicrobiota bacterium]